MPDRQQAVRLPIDGFHALFPGKPAVSETKFTSQAGFVLPEHVYRVDKGNEHYSLRVIDFRGVEQMGAERVKKCPAGAEPCLGNANLAGIGYWKHDVRGTPYYVLLQFLKKDVQVTEMFWNQLDLVAGVMAQIVNKNDQSRSFIYIAMHEMRLYVAEARVPAGFPEPAIFTQSVGWLDKGGRVIRYQNMYNHEVHGLREAPVPGTTSGYAADGTEIPGAGGRDGRGDRGAGPQGGGQQPQGNNPQ